MPDSPHEHAEPRDRPQPAGRRIRRHLRRWWWAWYLVLLAASHATQSFVPASTFMLPRDNEQAIETPLTTRDGVVEGESIELAVLSWGPPASTKPPVILLHGSPGDAGNFNELAPVLAAAGYRVHAPDLPGYGNSTRSLPDYSPRAQARAIAGMLESLGIDRAHIVGWSIGGGVAIQLADIAPERMESMTLLASIGLQETEGSGSWFFEHVKYAFGYATLVVGVEAVPHFGLLPRWYRRTFIRNFWDMDQRTNRAIMERTQIPTLVLHGRYDFLTAAWAAEAHHAVMPNSRLVMLSASHFLPFRKAELTAEHLIEHFDAVESGRFEPGELILEPARDRGGLAGLIDRSLVGFRGWWWGWQALAVLGLGLACARIGVFVAGIAFAAWLIAGVHLDFGVATTGLVASALLAALLSERFGGGFTRPDRMPRRPASLGGWLWLPAAVLLSLAFARLISPLATVAWFDGLGTPGLLAGLLVVTALTWFVQRIWTFDGRVRIRGALGTLRRHEFWPVWVFYAPLLPWLCWLAIRHRGVMLFTRVNPGIAEGGGIVGESKIEILRALRHAGDELLHAECVEQTGDPGERAERARALVERTPALGGYPIIAKPDRAERGAGVALIREPASFEAYFNRVRMDVVLQRFDPGPAEFGVLWVRTPERVEASAHGTPGEPALAGRVFSICKKSRPVVIGDGRRTLRELIARDPRLRCRYDWWTSGRAPGVPDPDAVVPAGEERAIGSIGNHAEGAIFRDGASRITPALESAIDRIARAVRALDGSEGGLDFGRFDIRCASEEALARAEGLRIIELNGTFSESSNLYDPDRSVFFAYRVLFAQWRELYRLGAWRRARGGRGISPAGFLRLVLGHRASQRASIASESGRPRSRA